MQILTASNLKVDLRPPCVNISIKIAPDNRQGLNESDIIILLSLPFWQQKGGADIEHFLSFLVSVMASVVGYYIRKWLDEHDKGGN